MLISAGADVNNVTTAFVSTPLYAASCKGHAEVVSVLIAAGADLNKRGRVTARPRYLLPVGLAIRRWSGFCSAPGPT